jgi:ERCC4-type nuclease
MLWVWRGEEEGSSELIAGWIVERKTLQDLSASVVDGRYDEQKLRLLEAPGLDGVIYLVEGNAPLFGVGEHMDAAKADRGRNQQRGFGHRLNYGLPPSTLSTTACHTQFISGFHVVHATSTSHSVGVLVALHGALLAQGPPSAALVPYKDFAERTRKCCHRRVFDTFGRMLRLVPSCGPEATEALVDVFQTPSAFAAALRDTTDAELLARLRARRGGGRAPVNSVCLAALRELFTAT